MDLELNGVYAERAECTLARRCGRIFFVLATDIGANFQVPTKSFLLELSTNGTIALMLLKVRASNEHTASSTKRLFIIGSSVARGDANIGYRL